MVTKKELEAQVTEFRKDLAVHNQTIAEAEVKKKVCMDHLLATRRAILILEYDDRDRKAEENLRILSETVQQRT